MDNILYNILYNIKQYGIISSNIISFWSTTVHRYDRNARDH